ncbi:MAG: restriction endonuclease [Desulfobacterales bacterium]|nr:restriction endonuclease [Desulfobacterales bacterium]
MSFRFFKKDAQKKQHVVWLRYFTDKGLLIFREMNSPDDLETKFLKYLYAPDASALLEQLVEEGLAVEKDNRILISWDQVYSLNEHAEYATSIPILELPPKASFTPILSSHNSLIDYNFAITISGWEDESGCEITIHKLVGALAVKGNEFFILQRAVWDTIQRIIEFQKRRDEDRTDIYHRSMWGIIRQKAIIANARLDDFLLRSIVLTPEKLDIGLRLADIGGTKVVEIAPGFSEAPLNWLDIFDRNNSVLNRYDIITSHGIVQVLITPQVRTVLEQIKRLDHRRVAGSRAEAFLVNPFAALGEDAIQVIDPQQFEQAREDAGLFFDRFTAYISYDALYYPESIGILIESAGKNKFSKSEIYLFTDDKELETFINSVQCNFDQGKQLFGWKGYDFELLGDTIYELNKLRNTLKKRNKPKILVDYTNVYDLSRYYSRIEGIGIEKPYYSPYIAKKNRDEGWFPENLIPVISFQHTPDSEPVAIPITREARNAIEAKIVEAKKNCKNEFELSGFPMPISVNEAENILRSFDEALNDINNKKHDLQKITADSKNRKGLIIKANIQSIDYEEALRDILIAFTETPEITSFFRQQEYTLLPHQLKGIARLQHLFQKSPENCRGVLLADDMGLGKTLQLLYLIAWVFEKFNPIDPVLVVAPVSLLENWEKEVKKFFRKDTLPILTVYGETIKVLKVSRANIDEQLRADRLVKFFMPNWRGESRIVLTTYETLRDFEFSFAEYSWSIMVCDEAQRIKNPNALITRSAKKQNVRFKIACTGTPVENSLTDLWCLFDFIQPGFLGALNEFSQQYLKPIESKTDEEKKRVEELRQKIDPQVIRRIKQDVINDLPQKIEQDLFIKISNDQLNLYAQAIELFRKRHSSNSKGPFKNHLGLLLNLRLVCTDPRRYGLDVFNPEPFEEYCSKAPKLKWLLNKLSEIKTRGEKAIIFCEFKGIQRLLKHYITQVVDFSPDIINGDSTASSSATNSRQKRIENFQVKKGFAVIILSPLAVGFGVNIQEANHVIHYTRTWNPAKEDQATDRAYRIGQTKDVFVYYPIIYAEEFTTFDVKLNKLLKSKRELAKDMLNGTGEIRPCDFDIDDVLPPDIEGKYTERRLTIDDVLQMRPDYFEGFVAALWQKMGFTEVQCTPMTGDDGVDVVAIKKPDKGELIQCKSSTIDNYIGWDGIKDVVTGAAAYERRYPRICFMKVCVTNQHFNSTAKRHAENNSVELYDQDRLETLLNNYPLTMFELERFIFREWGQI